MESIEVIMELTFREACVNLVKVAYPKALTLLLTRVKRVIFCVTYYSWKAALRSLVIVKEKAAAVTELAG